MAMRTCDDVHRLGPFLPTLAAVGDLQMIRPLLHWTLELVHGMALNGRALLHFAGTNQETAILGVVFSFFALIYHANSQILHCIHLFGCRRRV